MWRVSYARELLESGEPLRLFARVISGRLQTREQCVAALLDIAEADPRVRRAMTELEIHRSDLETLFTELVAAGAGVWMGWFYVPASVITDAIALRIYYKSDRGSWADIEVAAKGIVDLFRQRLRRGESAGGLDHAWRAT